MLGIHLHDYFFGPLLIFFEIIFLEKFFQEYHQGVNLDPDQAQHFVGLDLGQNCLQRLSAEDKIHYWQGKT